MPNCQHNIPNCQHNCQHKNPIVKKKKPELACTCNDNRCVKTCNQPYRLCIRGMIGLNIKAPKCLITSPTFAPIYRQLYNAILNNNLEMALTAMIQANNQAAYDLFLNNILTIFGITLGDETPRVVVAEANGTVILDTYKTADDVYSNFTNTSHFVTNPGNTNPSNKQLRFPPTDNSNHNLGSGQNNFYNWQNKQINENHNTRVAFMAAQMFPCGVGYETRYSTALGVTQYNVAIRLGPYLNNPGTIRLSISAT